ncbi:MAG: LysR family transcriptional regulator [Ilumatobacteraceae bacterium]
MQSVHTIGEGLAPALSTFLAVHRAGSISAAAHDLHLSQPAISRRLQQLERQLGVALFDRVPGGLRLSSAGNVFLAYAERADAAQRDAVAAVIDHRDRVSGTVDVGVVGSLVEPWLTTVLTSVAAEHPGVELAVSTATSRQIRDDVLRGAVTLGISYARPTEPSLSVRTLFEEELVVVAAPGHPRAGRSVRSLDALRDERWLVFPDQPGHPESANSIARALLAQHQVRADRVRPVDSLTAQRALARAGYGLAFLPESAVAADVAGGLLATVRVRGVRVAAPVTLLTRRNAYLSPAAQAVIRELVGTSR